MFLVWSPTFLRRGASPGDVVAASASFSFAGWALAREFSLQCSVPLAAQGDVECLVGSTSLLDVEGVMLKIQTGSEKNKIFPRLVEEHTYVCWKHVMKYKTLLLRNKTFCSKLVGVSAQDVCNMTGMLPRDWIALNIVMAQPEALHCRTLPRQGSLSKRAWSRCRSDIPGRRSASKKSRSPKRNMCHSKRWCLIYIRRAPTMFQTLQL